MVVLRPEPLVLEDERSKALFFKLVAVGPGGAFDLADLMCQWFDSDERVLAAFLEWLDVHGLEIRKKQ